MRHGSSGLDLAEQVGDFCTVLAFACSHTHLDMVRKITDSDMEVYIEQYRKCVRVVQSEPYAAAHNAWFDQIKRERARDHRRFQNFKRWKRNDADASARPHAPHHGAISADHGAISAPHGAISAHLGSRAASASSSTTPLGTPTNVDGGGEDGGCAQRTAATSAPAAPDVPTPNAALTPNAAAAGSIPTPAPPMVMPPSPPPEEASGEEEDDGVAAEEQAAGLPKPPPKPPRASSAPPPLQCSHGGRPSWLAIARGKPNS